MANTEPNGKRRNLVYVFVPFRFEDADGVLSAAKSRCEEGDAIWEDGSKAVKSYFFKYLTDKFTIADDGGVDCRRCIHLSAKEWDRGKEGVRPEDEWEKILSAQKSAFGFSMKDGFVLLQPSYLDDTQRKMNFCFHIDSLKLTVFRTGIGLVSFGLVFEDVDPLKMGAAEFLLKLSIEELDRTSDYGKRNSIVKMAGCEVPTDFATVAHRVLESAIGLKRGKFNFYSQKPRGNLFSVFFADGQECGSDFEESLYYLGNGYGFGFMYPGKEWSTTCQFLGDPNIRWCVSNEVASCLVRPDMHLPGRGFIYGSFYYKFRREYLFMYIWLLHQKYALYAFLTDISASGLGAAGRKNAKELQDYKERFTEFEANYVFARITEVPQYQQLYDAVSKQFALGSMYDDVKEPLAALDDLARLRESRSQNGIAIVLSGIAVLSVFSAYIDSYDAIGKFFGENNSWMDGGIRTGQLFCAIVITLVVLIGLVWIFMFVTRGGIFKSKGASR